MNYLRRSIPVLALCFALAAIGAANGQPAKKPYVPQVGQEGRDAIWVPTPFVTVEKMLDVAGVTPKDLVMDLGSGDGRNVIAAARRGARAIGVEYNNDLVLFSRGEAQKAGVSEKASFVQGDMYIADVSKADVLALFLLTQNMDKMVPNFLKMRPGSRIVVNGFTITNWEIDETHRAQGDCGNWCTVHLYVVPANVTGAWRIGQAELILDQRFQILSGTLNVGGKSVPVENGRLRGAEIVFTAGGTTYTGRVDGDAMQGEMKGAAGGAWSAARK